MMSNVVRLVRSKNNISRLVFHNRAHSAFKYAAKNNAIYYQGGGNKWNKEKHPQRYRIPKSFYLASLFTFGFYDSDDIENSREGKLFRAIVFGLTPEVNM